MATYVDETRLAVRDVADDANVERRLLLIDQRAARSTVRRRLHRSRHHRLRLTIHLLFGLALLLTVNAGRRTLHHAGRGARCAHAAGSGTATLATADR